MTRACPKPGQKAGKSVDSFNRRCVLAMRANIARHMKGMNHRDFCVRRGKTFATD